MTSPDPSSELDEALHQALDELADGGAIPPKLEGRIEAALSSLYVRVARDLCSALATLLVELETPRPGDLPFRPLTPFPFDDPQVLVLERMRVTPRAFLPLPDGLGAAIERIQGAITSTPSLAWSLGAAHVLVKQRLDLRLDDPISRWLDARRDALGTPSHRDDLDLVDAVASTWIRAAFLRRVTHAPVTPRTQAAVARFRQRVLASAGPIERTRALCLDDPTLATTAAAIVAKVTDPGAAADAFREILIERAVTSAREGRASPLTPWRIALMLFVIALFVLLFTR